ncbi:carboxypeptidase-like regulatory domain-containing protein [Singulisphaera sp. PoT]|uniref:carboxypeptidase-like regulatory domain-containing protein n=1 Tax=Singulisphaera sp. PoT TaxID=3411797 RepID=UPI003BF4AECB
MLSLFLNLAIPLAMVAGPGGSDLKGVVVSEAGTPIAGVDVFIATAAPRSGTSPLCPSCYADCAKRAKTDAAGAFEIKGLDPSLLFQVLFVAKGHKARYAQKVDPAAKALSVTLAKLDLSTVPTDRVIHGRILNPEGSPVVGATVEPSMFETEAFSGYSPDIFDPIAVTDASGEFWLTARSPIRTLAVKVEARGLARRIVPELKPGRVASLSLLRGVQVSGRLVRDGKAVEGAVVGLVQVRRGMGEFVGTHEIATDSQGRFVLSNIAPQDDYYLYGKMASLNKDSALTCREIKVGRDGTSQDLGEINMQPAHSVAGRVVLSDGKPIPPGTRLMLSREEAWDWQSATLDPEGKFSIEGVPADEIHVNVRLKGYHLSPKNKTRDGNNPSTLSGFVEEDIRGLTILLEPGED